jgi:hypothetical protein
LARTRRWGAPASAPWIPACEARPYRGPRSSAPGSSTTTPAHRPTSTGPATTHTARGVRQRREEPERGVQRSLGGQVDLLLRWSYIHNHDRITWLDVSVYVIPCLSFCNGMWSYPSAGMPARLVPLHLLDGVGVLEAELHPELLPRRRWTLLHLLQQLLILVLQARRLRIKARDACELGLSRPTTFILADTRGESAPHVKQHLAPILLFVYPPPSYTTTRASTEASGTMPGAMMCHRRTCEARWFFSSCRSPTRLKRLSHTTRTPTDEASVARACQRHPWGPFYRISSRGPYSAEGVRSQVTLQVTQLFNDKTEVQRLQTYEDPSPGILRLLTFPPAASPSRSPPAAPVPPASARSARLARRPNTPIHRQHQQHGRRPQHHAR